ncbi:MAG: phosphatidate cytidylyltransferase [Candidatus Aminicenantes bacterium]|nr:phosphatidate cytidylyltransferase [Candidatus Aminicenantes bacterium]
MSDRQRTPTALFLLAILLSVVQWAPAWGFFAAVQFFILAALWEFYNLARRRRLRPQRLIGLATALMISASFLFPRFPLALALFLGLLAAGAYFLASVDSVEKLAVFPSGIALTFFGAVYVALPMNYLYWIRVGEGKDGIYFLFLVIFLGDTGAYLIGKTLGRHKMAPLASPKKTWEGAVGGLVFALAGSVAVRFLLLPYIGLLAAASCGVVVHAVAQMSDPLESLFKRAAGVKDSSNLLPGHGGFLDRVDSFLLAAPFFYYFVRLFWK